MNEKFNLIVCQIIVVFVSIFTVACANMDGYCASIAIDAGASQSILNGVNAFGSGSFNFSTMNPAMLPALYDNINMNLYQTFGYDINDAIDYGADHLTAYATGEIPNPLNDAQQIPLSSANWLASKMLQAETTAANLVASGYQYFAQSIPQWGENAKQFFIGKKNEITGAIESAGANVVTKVTAEGLFAYNQIYNNLVQSNDIVNASISGVFMVSKFVDTYRTSTSSTGIRSLNITFNEPVFIYTDTFTTSPSRHLTHIVCPSSKLINHDNHLYLPCHGLTNQGTIFYLSVYSSNRFTINNVEYINFTFSCCDSSFNDISASLAVGSQKIISSLANIQSYLTSIDYDVSTASLSYDYSSADISVALKNQLDRLIGKYIDSLTLQRVNDIISSIPVGVENVGESDIPVAIPTQEVVDELTGVIDEAITDSATYEEVFDAYYEDAIDVPVPPDPEPVIPDYTGTLVPTPFPDDAFSPINGGINSVFSMASLFEPIFYVFSAFSGLFSLWLVVPFVLLFGILIRLLK